MVVYEIVTTCDVGEGGG